MCYFATQDFSNTLKQNMFTKLVAELFQQKNLVIGYPLTTHSLTFFSFSFNFLSFTVLTFLKEIEDLTS